MSWYYRDWERTRPIRPANGIKARTQRGAFGKSWWASRWIAALERLVDSGRLARGRSYARNGQVLSLDVQPEGIAARVQGSRPAPYQVSIKFRRLSDDEWEKVADAMAAEALYAAKLLSGEMPEHIEEAFAAAGTSLFPDTGKDLVTECSCPDWSNPCKHVAAVHYLLGERFDADPFLIFLLRGWSKDDIIAALRARRAGAAADEEAAVEAEEEEEAAPALVRAMSVSEFWALPSEVEEMRVSFEAPPVAALAVKRLGPPLFLRDSGAFTKSMEESYRSVSSHALRMIGGDE